MATARYLQGHQPRTEVDVAADAIVAIVDARILPFTPGIIGRLSVATGVPVAEIKKALELKESGRRAPLPTRQLVAVPPLPAQGAEPSAPVVKHAKPQGGAAHRNRTRTAAAYPTPDTRRCSKCEAVKSVDDFDWKDRKKGYRRSIDRYGCPAESGSTRSSGLAALGWAARVLAPLRAAPPDARPQMQSPLAMHARTRRDDL